MEQAQDKVDLDNFELSFNEADFVDFDEVDEIEPDVVRLLEELGVW